MEQIIENVEKIREELPEGVKLEAAAKTRNAEEVRAAIQGGVDFLGYNYVQEGLQISRELKDKYGTDFPGAGVEYHLIGPLQKNKINKALGLFSMIETVESIKKAEEIDKRAQRGIDILLQVNIGYEESKSGAYSDQLFALAERIIQLSNIRLCGLMVIEPYEDDPEDSRKYFQEMKNYFDKLKEHVGDNFVHLSMGMSHNYRVAVEQGSTIVRIGTRIFGPRN